MSEENIKDRIREFRDQIDGVTNWAQFNSLINKEHNKNTLMFDTIVSVIDIITRGLETKFPEIFKTN